MRKLKKTRETAKKPEETARKHEGTRGTTKKRKENTRKHVAKRGEKRKNEELQRNMRNHKEAWGNTKENEKTQGTT